MVIGTMYCRAVFQLDLYDVRILSCHPRVEVSVQLPVRGIHKAISSHQLADRLVSTLCQHQRVAGQAVVFQLGIHVLHLVFVIGEDGDRPDEVAAALEHVHHGNAVIIKLHPVMHLHPSGNAFVIAGIEIHAVLLTGLCDGYAVALFPDGRVGNAVDALAFEPSVLVLHPLDLLEYFVGRPFHTGVWLVRHAAIQLQDVIQASVIVHRPPGYAERLAVTEVKASPDAPGRRDFKWIYHVGPLSVLVMCRIVGELLKDRSSLDTPVAQTGNLVSFGVGLFHDLELAPVSIVQPLVAHVVCGLGQDVRIFWMVKEPLLDPVAL